MRKLTAIVLMLVMCVALCACTIDEAKINITDTSVEDRVVAKADKNSSELANEIKNEVTSSAEEVTDENDTNSEEPVKNEATSQKTEAPSKEEANSVTGKLNTSSKEEPLQTDSSIVKPSSSAPAVAPQPETVIKPTVKEDGLVTAQMLNTIQDGFLKLINAERVKNGLDPVTFNAHLDNIAQIRSSEIIEAYSHTRPNGTKYSSLVDTKKYRYTVLGEIVGEACHSGKIYSSTDHFTGSDEQIIAVYTNMFNAFKASPKHYALILNSRFAHTGVGVSYQIDSDTGVPIFFFSEIFGNK